MIEYRNDIKIEDYINLRRAVGWKILDLELSKRSLEGSAYMVVAYDNESRFPIGMGRVITDGGYMALIVDVIVHPDYQKKGIGGQIITKLNEYFDKITSNGDILVVNIMSTKGNEAFYEKYGYTLRPNESMGAGLCRWYNND